jgi:DsbC/DsbD-like thiol-disulfide interchange protein
MTRFFSGFVLVTAAAFAAALTAHAADTPDHSSIRLIAGAGHNAAGQLRAGVEISMKPGWKTYWRYPGDSGVPPRFDFSGSTNLASATVLWPAPHMFRDESGKSIGYKGNAIFPLVVTPKQKGEPVTLKLKIDYAVCEKLCVPAEGEATLTLDGTSGGKSGNDDALLTAAEAQVPQPVSAAAAGLTVKRIGGKQKPMVVVDLPAPRDGKARDIFVEGPTADWALPIPATVPDAPAGRSRYGFELDGLPAGIDPKEPVQLTFTIVGGDRPIEVKTRLE